MKPFKKQKTELRPRRGAWFKVPDAQARQHFPQFDGEPLSVWTTPKGLAVSSALHNAEYPDKSGVGPQYLIAISAKGNTRPTDQECNQVLADFGMSEADEDNHYPGSTRQFWQPLDPEKRQACHCKEAELTITEQDGYQWTTPENGPCRGCEFEIATGKLCPIHSQQNEYSLEESVQVMEGVNTRFNGVFKKLSMTHALADYQITPGPAIFND